MGYSALDEKRFVAAVCSTVDTQVKILSLDRDNLTGNWTTRDTVSVVDGARRHVSFDTGLGHCFYTSPVFDGVRQWNGAGSSGEVTGSPSGSRAVCFHAQRIWAGDGTDLVSSALDDGTTWPGVTIPVGADDGEPIEALVEVGDDLVIGKENTLWVLSGAGVNTFALHKIPGIAGCAPGTSLINTPYGVVVIGREAVWVWDQGGPPQLISRAIEKNYGMTGRYVSGTYIDGRCYVIDEGASDYWVFSPEDGRWWMETIDGAENAITNVYALGNTLLAGPAESTVASVAMYRYHPVEPGARAKDLDTLEQTFLVKTPEMWLGGENRKATIRHLSFKLRQRDGFSYEAPLEITPYRDGVAMTAKEIEPKNSAGTYRADLSFGYDCWSTQFKISQTLRTGERAVFDIEAAKLEYDISGRR